MDFFGEFEALLRLIAEYLAECFDNLLEGVFFVVDYYDGVWWLDFWLRVFYVRCCGRSFYDCCCRFHSTDPIW